MKISTATAIVTASVSVAAVSSGMAVMLFKQATTLKMDNLELLKKTTRILECVDLGVPIPSEILTDIEFRCIAAVEEAQRFSKKD